MHLLVVWSKGVSAWCMMKLPYNSPIELINQTAFLVTRSGSFFFIKAKLVHSKTNWLVSFILHYFVNSKTFYVYSVASKYFDAHPTDFDLPKCVHHLTWFIENKSSHFLIFCLQICRNTLIWTLTVQERCRELQTD